MAEDPTELLIVDSPSDRPLTADADEAEKPPKSPSVGFTLLLVAALLGGLIGGGVVAITTRDTGGDTNVTFSPGANLKLRRGALDIQGVLAKTEPAVVSIETDSFVRQNGFFGPTVSRVRGAGTGMVLSADGDILTNNHVVEGAQRITVTFTGQNEGREADLVGADPASDVAILRLRNASGLRTVTLGSSSSLEVGDDVVAIGNALALVGGNTVTRGIVSALERSVEDSRENLRNLIQTDAAINSGNSGGPLVDARGEVVGMNTIVIRGTGTGAPVESIGFAIAIDPIKPLIARLRSGKPAPGTPFLGLATIDMIESLKAELRVPVSKGALVQDVTAGSPSEATGLRVGDVVVSFAGKDVESAAGLVALVRDREPGDKVEIVWYRGEMKKTATLTVGSRTIRQ